MFKRLTQQKTDWPYTIDFNNDELKRYMNSFSEKNFENLFKVIDIYYSMLLKQEIEKRIDNRESNPSFEEEMKGLLQFRKYLKTYCNDKSVVN